MKIKIVLALLGRHQPDLDNAIERLRLCSHKCQLRRSNIPIDRLIIRYIKDDLYKVSVLEIIIGYVPCKYNER